ncbi:MAG TPA: HAMP domain-containing sensor histidine kinase [Verrucomicrobiae bacterium]|nr:HAMP domain-containing sensor histidine kinase [Verrucomicrobiae bacterium]
MSVVPDRELHDALLGPSLAHELKTPIASLGGASRGLRTGLQSILTSLSACGQLEPAAIRDLGALVAEDLASAERRPPITGPIPQERLDAAARALNAAGVRGDIQDISAVLVRGGWDDRMEEVAPLLAAAEPHFALEILEAAAKLRSSLRSLDATVSRLAGIAASVTGDAASDRAAAEATPLKASVEDALATLRHEVPSNLHLELHGADGILVKGGAGRVGQIVSNVLSNAFAALRGTGGRVEIEVFRIGPHGVVTITDDGPGIPEAIRRDLFSPYVTGRKDGEGTGLGLFIAREIVVGLGGDLSFESRPGRTCFTIRLEASGASGASGEP